MIETSLRYMFGADLSRFFSFIDSTTLLDMHRVYMINIELFEYGTNL